MLYFESSDTKEDLTSEAVHFMGLSSAWLLTIIDDLFELGNDFGVVFFFPSVVRCLNTFLHLFQSLLQHL